MIKPKLPPGESSRLQTLHSLNVLDTEAEERFDRLTRLARKLFDVPVSLVSLVDADRQWFKSATGLDAKETPRDISFCGHAILYDEILVIPDATADVRFADNPLVEDEPCIRFYAGSPLKVFGSLLGTLCIIDYKPKTFSDDELVLLRDLTVMVETELEAMHLATQDQLTDILNRRGFLLLGQKSLDIYSRQGSTSTLVFFDLNEFKTINDDYGHTEGDQALIAFAELMKESFRDADVYGRLGGDEFVALLNDANDYDASKVLERFRASIEQYNQESDRGYSLSYSQGTVDIDPAQEKPLEKWLAEVDQVMYEEKKKQGNGKNWDKQA